MDKSPCGGEGTGPNPTDRAKAGWKWSILTDLNGIPFGWAAEGANRHDSILLGPTLADAATRGLLADIETLWLDRGYDSAATRTRLCDLKITDAVIAKKRKRGDKPATKTASNKHTMGLRWPVERTNSWLSNYGQLRRNTDRRSSHRLAQLALAIALLLIAKLIDWRNRWSKASSPIRRASKPAKTVLPMVGAYAPRVGLGYDRPTGYAVPSLIASSRRRGLRGRLE